MTPSTLTTLSPDEPPDHATLLMTRLPAEPPPAPDDIMVQLETTPSTPPGLVMDCIRTWDHQANRLWLSYTTSSLADTQASFQECDEPPNVTDSVVRITVRPRVFGVQLDSTSTIRIKRHSHSLMDGGANICLTGDLSILVGVVDIPLMPITVATAGSNPTLDDNCTKRGFLPLTLPDGSIYWQLCFFCTNAAETIISPQAILASSDVYTSWTQTGYKDGCHGTIRFDSDNGFLTMRLNLAFKDGLYYCPTDVFTICPALPLVDPSYSPCPLVPAAARIHQERRTATTRQPSQYQPTQRGNSSSQNSGSSA